MINSPWAINLANSGSSRYLSTKVFLGSLFVFIANPFHPINLFGFDRIAFFDKTVRNNYPTIGMEIARHPDLRIFKFIKICAFYFLELLSVNHFPFICQPFYYSQNFFSIEFREAIQKFIPWAPAIGSDGKLNLIKLPFI